VGTTMAKNLWSIKSSRGGTALVTALITILSSGMGVATAQIRPTAKESFTVAAPKPYIEAYKEAISSLGVGSRIPTKIGYLSTCCSVLLGRSITATSLRVVMRQCTPRYLVECVGLNDQSASSSKQYDGVAGATSFLRAPLPTPNSFGGFGSTGGSGSTGGTAQPAATATPRATATVFVSVTIAVPDPPQSNDDIPGSEI